MSIYSSTSKLATASDIEKDTSGYTNPNLHRRVDPKEHEGESLPRSYQFAIQGVDSYRATSFNFHDEESDDSEIP